MLCRLPPHGPLTASSFSRFFSAQVCSATTKTTTIPCPPPPGGKLCTKGERDKNKREFVYCCGHTCTHRHFFFPLFFRGRLQETLSDCFTMWDTDDVSGVVCVRGGEKNPSRSTRVLCTLFLPRASVLSCTLFLLFIVSKPPVSLFFFFLLAWARIVNIGFGEYEPPCPRTKAIILRTAFIHRTVPECRCFTCKV